MHHHLPSWESLLPQQNTPAQPHPCAILLSEVGKCYHAFPKGTFKARFTPPAVPCSVLSYVCSHPLTWSWKTKAGPKAGKIFTIPTVPTSCGKDSPRAVHWIVSIFHAFKSQLAPCALDSKTGWVLPAYIKVYQNNMLLHLRAQQASSQAKPPSSSPQTKAPQRCPPPLPPSGPSAELNQLRADLTARDWQG